MASPVAAESTKSKPGPKTLSHLEIHPQMGGGVEVHHVYRGYEHQPRPYKFAADEAERFHAHIGRHSGMGHEASAEPDEE